MPVLQALVLADRIYTDTSGKKIIAGTFNGLRLQRNKPPEQFVDEGGKKKFKIKGGQPGAPWAYISLTDVWDGTKLSLQFASLTRNRVLFETEVTITCNDRLGNVEIIAPLPRLPISEPGVYAFEVVCEGEIIGSHRIVARLVDETPESEGDV